MPRHVVLREVRDEDLPTFFANQADPEASRMANFPPRDRGSFLAQWTKILLDDAVVVRAIEYEGGVAGNVVSWVHDEERDVGYWIGREHWGRGIASAALGAFLDELEDRPLFAHVAEHDRGSIRVLEKCGSASLGPAPVADQEETELLFRLDPPQDSATIA